MKRTKEDYVYQAIRELGISDNPEEFCEMNQTVLKVAAKTLSIFAKNIKEYTMVRKFAQFEEADKFIELFLAKNIGHSLVESKILTFDRTEERGIVTLTGRVFVFKEEENAQASVH